MLENTWFEKFTNALAEDTAALPAWDPEKLADWTSVATKAADAATAAVLECMAVGVGQTAAKEAQDKYGRSEYFTLDGIGYDDASWAPPLVAVELENTSEKIEYCAWKLLCVRASVRVLVCFKKTLGAYPGSTAEAVARVAKVLKDHRGQRLFLVVGDADARVTSKDVPEWRSVFETRLLP